MYRKIFSLFLSSFSFILVGSFVSPQFAFANQTATLHPLSDGSFTQWTPSTGTSHFATVDENSCNGLSDYVFTSTVGGRDSYNVNISTIPNGATITQIQLQPCASRNSSGGTNPVMNVFYRLNGANSADSGSYSLTGTTPTVLSSTFFSVSTVKSSTTTLEFGAVLTSGSKGARLSQLAGIVTYTPLATPSGLTAQALGTESAKLTWTDNSSNETGFKIERSTDNINFVQIATISANKVSYIDPNIIGTYYYQVRAYNSGGDTSYSNVASVTVSLNAPISLSATGSTGSAHLSWTDKSANEDGFKIERSTDNINFSQIDTVGVNVTSYDDLGLLSGLYYYRVKAYKGTIDSDYSNTSSTTVL